jgi:hypothetical protein
MMGTQFPETCTEVEINVLRSSVHLVGFIWKRLYRDVRSTKHKIQHRISFVVFVLCITQYSLVYTTAVQKRIFSVVKLQVVTVCLSKILADTY